MEQRMVLEIKKQRIDEGKPVICVPVIETQKDAIIKEVELLVKKQVKMIEWRMDWFEQAEDLEAVRAVLSEMQPYLKETILLATFRTKKQGGQLQPEQGYLIKLYQMIAESGLADILDVEYYEWENVKQVIHEFQHNGVRIISSHHDFEKTPSTAEMKEILASMAEAGADIVKLAVMPQDKEDVLRLLSVTCAFKELYSIPTVTMSMGRDGMISRISGELFGSCVTFGSHQQPSAPGQLQMEKLETILTYLHESYEK